MTFDELHTSYLEHRKALRPLDFTFLQTFSDVALREGRIRWAIEIIREALLVATSDAERASIYLSLCRMYRQMIHMQNARDELERAFKALSLPYPRPTIVNLFGAIGTFLSSVTHAFFSTQPRLTDTERSTYKMIFALYVETGLSAYYIREKRSMLTSSLRAYRYARFLGPHSMEMADWLGATGCMFADLGLRRLSHSFLTKSERIAKKVGRASEAKQKIWAAISTDYLYDSPKAAALCEALIAEYKDVLEPHDLNFISSGLSTNYALRGDHIRERQAIERLYTPYDRTCTELFSCNKTFVEWLTIPAHAYQNETTEIERILQNSKAIFASVDKEKWEISRYLGTILIYYYLSGQHGDAVKDIVARFKALELTPRNTFLEGWHYWVAFAYVTLLLFEHQALPKREASRALEQLKEVSRHPTLRAHYYCAEAQYLLLEKKYGQARRSLERAEELAAQTSNYWATYEARRIGMALLFAEGNKEEGARAFEKLRQYAREREWPAMLDRIEEYRRAYNLAL